ncbi:unnamed protein product, partial [Iphiclides podalirius]
MVLKGIAVLPYCALALLSGLTNARSGDVSSFQLLARLSFPTVETTERREILETAHKRLFSFIDTHIKDLKRLLFETDMALMSMVLLKLNKKMDTSEAKIKSTQAKIPFGLYASPEFKCLGTSYYIASAHNQDDAQMILSSERKPHCYTFRGAFAFSGFYHRHSETTYVGPHAEQFQAKDPSQGLYCHSDDNWSDAQCIYKINPREEFPESVEYEPKSSDLSFMYQNGQVFYTDEPWAGMSCWNWACKWRHNQNQRSNEFFVN